MDQKLLDALNNLSVALEQLNDSLDKSKSGEAKSDVGTSLQSGNFGDTLKEITVGIQSIKDDTKKILDNQQTLIKMQKEQSSSETKLFEDAGGGKTKQMIKDGVAVIGLIAGAVLAIGLAFKLIGQVDFFSVIALSFALPMIAKAFATIAEVENLDLASIPIISLAIVGMSLAIMLSSHILSKVAPVSIFQLVTTVGIAAAFGAAAFGLGMLIFGLGQINPALAVQASFILPIVLIATSIAIAASSVILSAVQPIGLLQALTTILIAGAFGVMAAGIGVLVASFKGINPATAAIAALSIPIVMIAVSYAITQSSIIFQNIQPIGLFQALTAILISATFVVLSYAVKPLLSGVKNVEYGDLLMGTLIMIGLVSAITLSSIIMQEFKVVTLGEIFSFVALSIGLAASTFVMGLAIKGFNLLGLGIDDILKGGVVIVALAGAIAVSSLILSLGKYDVFPSLDWALGVSLSLAAFGIGVAILGSLVMTGIGGVALLAGAAAVVGLAGTIVLVSEVLSKGKYDIFPSLDWAKGVGTSLLMFATAVVILGVINSAGGLVETLSFGAVDNPIDAGISAVFKIAYSIVKVSEILGSGSYDIYPSSEWISGVGTSLIQFASQMMFYSVIGMFLTPGIIVVNSLVSTIAHIDNVFSNGDFTIFPNDDWIRSSILSISKYSQLSLNLSSIILEVLLGNLVIFSVVGLISSIDAIFSQGNWETYPSQEWTDSTSYTIMEYAKMSLMFSLLSLPIFLGSLVVMSMVTSIVFIDKLFSMGSWDTLPGRVWIDDLSYIIGGYSRILDSISIGDLFFGGFKLWTLKDMSYSILDIDNIFSQGNFDKYPTKGWVDGIFESLYSLNLWLAKLSNDDLDLESGILDKSSVSLMVSNITSLAMGFDILSNSVSKFSKSVNDINLDNLEAIKGLTSNVILLSLMDPDMLEEVMNKLEERGGVFADLIKDFEEKKSGSFAGGGGGLFSTSGGGDQNLNELKTLNKKLDNVSGLLAQISGVVSGDLRNYLLENSNNEKNIQTNRSDRRLKNIIRKIGVSESGINIYEFTYKFNNLQVYQGIIAQELIGTEFESALHYDKNGYYSVDYTKLDVEFKKLNKIH